MDNAEKLATLRNLPGYWRKQYPDAEIKLPDGTSSFSDDLIDYHQDKRLVEVERDFKRLITQVVGLGNRIEKLEDRLVAEIATKASNSDLEVLGTPLTSLIEWSKEVSAIMDNYKQLGEIAPDKVEVATAKWPWVVLTAVALLWPLVLIGALLLWRGNV